MFGKAAKGFDMVMKGVIGNVKPQRSEKRIKRLVDEICSILHEDVFCFVWTGNIIRLCAIKHNAFHRQSDESE